MEAFHDTPTLVTTPRMYLAFKHKVERYEFFSLKPNSVNQYICDIEFEKKQTVWTLHRTEGSEQFV